MAASNEKTSAFTSGMERKLIPTRICDAPGELVFKAWTDSKHMEQWWGPHGFANPVCEMDDGPADPIVFTCADPMSRVSDQGRL